MSEPAGTKPPYVLLVLVSFFVLAQCLAFAMRSPYGEPPDELAHLSYVADAQRQLIPDYRDGMIVGAGRPNYLSHPPAYYTALGLVSKAFNLDPFRDYRTLRAGSAVVFALGFLAFLCVLRNLGASSLGIVACGAFACATPMFGYLGGSINNDVLAYSSTALFLLGFSRYRFVPERLDTLACVLLVIGALGAVLSKATTAVFLVFFGVAALLIYARELRSGLHYRRLLTSLAIVAVVTAAYYVPTLVAYGTPFPRPEALYPPKVVESPLSVLEYGQRFVELMWKRLPVVMSHDPTAPYGPMGKQTFYTLVVIPPVALIVAMTLRNLSRDGTKLFASVLFATAGFAALHFHTAYTAYLVHGLLAGIQPRYYVFLIPLLFGAYTTARSRWFRDVLPLLSILAAVLLFWGGVPDLM